MMQLHDSLGPIFTFSSCHNAVLMFWLGTHSTWLGSGRHHVLATTNTTADGLTSHPKYPITVITNTAGNSPMSPLTYPVDYIGMQSELQPLAWQPCHLQPPPNILSSLQHESQVIHM